MFSRSLLIASQNVSSLENILPDIFSIGFKSGLGPRQNISCNEFSERYLFVNSAVWRIALCNWKIISARCSEKNNLSMVDSRHFPQKLIRIMFTVFAGGPGDQGSIPGRVIWKTLKMVLDANLLITLYYKVRIKGKWCNSGKGVAPDPTPRCSSCWKGSFRVAHDYGRQLYFLHTYVYIYMCMCVRMCV